MTIRHLRVFVAVCECGGVTKAAQALHTAQPSISYAIAEMEKHYNVSLFERINQRLILTEVGKELLIKAKEILAGFDDFEELAQSGSHSVTLRIGSSLTLGKTVLPEYLNRLKNALPNISPIVSINKTADIEKELELGNLDFGMVEGDVLSPHLRAIPFGGDSIVAVCAKDQQIPCELSLEELIKYPLLLREVGSASRNLFDQALSLNHLSAKPVLESVSNECIIASVEARLGISVLPESLVIPSIKDGKLKVLTVKDTDFRRNHSLLIHKNKKLSPLQSKALSLCEEMIR